MTRSELDEAIANRGDRGRRLLRAAVVIEVGTVLLAGVLDFVAFSSIRRIFPWTVNACGEWSIRVMVVPFGLSVIALALASGAPVEDPRQQRNRALVLGLSWLATVGWLVLLVAKDYPHCFA